MYKPGSNLNFSLRKFNLFTPFEMINLNKKNTDVFLAFLTIFDIVLARKIVKIIVFS